MPWVISDDWLVVEVLESESCRCVERWTGKFNPQRPLWRLICPRIRSIQPASRNHNGVLIKTTCAFRRIPRRRPLGFRTYILWAIPTHRRVVAGVASSSSKPVTSGQCSLPGPVSIKASAGKKKSNACLVGQRILLMHHECRHPW